MSASHPVFRVGLTGGIASGKSTVARLFAALGVPVIDTDALSREVMAPGTPLAARIATRFGPQVLDAQGALDRRALRRIVFQDARARADLEALTHPPIRAALEQRSASSPGPYQILAIPLLVEQGRRDAVARVLVVDSPTELQVRRLQARDGATLEEAQAILAAQATREARLRSADDVILNDGGIGALGSQVQALHARYLELAHEAGT